MQNAKPLIAFLISDLSFDSPRAKRARALHRNVFALVDAVATCANEIEIRPFVTLRHRALRAKLNAQRLVRARRSRLQH
jgi:hypothetical protein